MLREMFRNPLSDRDSIHQRNRIIAAFACLNFSFPFSAPALDQAEKYLLNAGEQGHEAGHHTVSLSEKEMSNGVSAILDLLRAAKLFIDQKEVASIPYFDKERERMKELLGHPSFEPALREKHGLSYSAVTAFDILFRVREHGRIRALLVHIYLLDVYMSVAKVAVSRHFAFPTVLEKGSGRLELEGVYHPGLKNPVSNDIGMEPDQNVIFLTGANMAGKSTFLRSVSTALYVAHLGFPVAARSMTFSVMDGIYTTINLPDKLGIGASHFYTEVLRVRKVATELGQGKSLFIIFDELFRGTNVKDAHEATVAVVLAFARKRRSLFIISSHIVEAAAELEQKSNIRFFYLPTTMQGTTPAYTYTLMPGVTDDRHGMIIIKNEGILDILKNGVKRRKVGVD